MGGCVSIAAPLKVVVVVVVEVLNPVVGVAKVVREGAKAILFFGEKKEKKSNKVGNPSR